MEMPSFRDQPEEETRHSARGRAGGVRRGGVREARGIEWNGCELEKTEQETESRRKRRS